MNAQLASNLRRLRLSGLATSLEVRLQEAAGNQLNHREFLELIINDELAVRDDRAIARRVTRAGFRELKSIEDFDFAFNPSINRRQIMELATGRFIRERTDWPPSCTHRTDRPLSLHLRYRRRTDAGPELRRHH